MKQIKNNIILIGMPGCGKSTAGKLISDALNFDFIDLDFLIEKNEGMKITEIFNKKGEKYFRELETETLKNLQGKEKFVLSAGGGTPQKEENIEIMKKLGTVFYLEIEPDKIYDRIKDDKTRPLLQKENPKEILSELYGKRKSAYEKADYKIDASIGSIKAADEVIKIYEKN